MKPSIVEFWLGSDIDPYKEEYQKHIELILLYVIIPCLLSLLFCLCDICKIKILKHFSSKPINPDNNLETTDNNNLETADNNNLETSDNNNLETSDNNNQINNEAVNSLVINNIQNTIPSILEELTESTSTESMSTESTTESTTSNIDPDNECPICLRNLFSSKSSKTIRTMSLCCNRVVHEECIMKWLQKNDHCVWCRQKIN